MVMLLLQLLWHLNLSLLAASSGGDTEVRWKLGIRIPLCAAAVPIPDPGPSNAGVEPYYLRVDADAESLGLTTHNRLNVLGGGSCLNAGFYTRASGGYVRAAGWDHRLVNASYRWVERALVFRPEVPQWQRALRQGLLQAGVTPDNGYTLEHVQGTKIEGTIFDRWGRRHTARVSRRGLASGYQREQVDAMVLGAGVVDLDGVCAKMASLSSARRQEQAHRGRHERDSASSQCRTGHAEHGVHARRSTSTRSGNHRLPRPRPSLTAAEVEGRLRHRSLPPSMAATSSGRSGGIATGGSSRNRESIHAGNPTVHGRAGRRWSHELQFGQRWWGPPPWLPDGPPPQRGEHAEDLDDTSLPR